MTTAYFLPGERVRWLDQAAHYPGLTEANDWTVERVEANDASATPTAYVRHASAVGSAGLALFAFADRFERIERAKPAFIFWCDIETTGLDPRADHILEIAWRLTHFDAPYTAAVDAHPLFGSGDFLVTSDGSARLVAGECAEFIRDMHDKSGLRAAFEAAYAKVPSTECATVRDVEKALLNLSLGWPLEDKDARVVVGGSSAHFDLGFLRVHMPAFAKRLSHRVFDVSAMLMQARSLGMPDLPREEVAHRARADVDYSLWAARELAQWHERRTRASTRPSVGDRYMRRGDSALLEWSVQSCARNQTSLQRSDGPVVHVTDLELAGGFMYVGPEEL